MQEDGLRFIFLFFKEASLQRNLYLKLRQKGSNIGIISNNKGLVKRINNSHEKGYSKNGYPFLFLKSNERSNLLIN